MPTVDSNGLRIHYDVSGQGPAILFLHSYLCNNAIWAAQAEAFSSSHRAVRVDLRGHGQSGTISATPSLEDLVDDALAVLDAEGIEKAVWAGLSIGGFIALRAALRTPERVTALVLADTDAGPEGWATRTRFRAMSAFVRLFGFKPLISQIRQEMFGKTTLKTNPTLVAEWDAHLAAMDVPSGRLMLPTVVQRSDLRHRLGEIKVPTLVVVGREDASLPVERSEVIAAGIPGAVLEVIERAGHLASVERPEAVTQAMQRFLADLR